MSFPSSAPPEVSPPEGAEATDPAAQGRSSARWPRVVAGAVGVSLALGLGAVWFTRTAIVEGVVRNVLTARGVDGAFAVERADFGGVTLAEVALGPQGAPDVAARRVRLALAWTGPAPRLAAVEVEDLVIQARSTPEGLAVPSLQAFGRGQVPGAALALPEVAVRVAGDSRFELVSDCGTLVFALSAAGQIGRDFGGEAKTVAPGCVVLRGALLDGVEGTIAASSPDGGLELTGALRAAEALGGFVTAIRLDGRYATTAADLRRGALTAELALNAPVAESVRLSATGQVAPDRFDGRVRAEAEGLWAGDFTAAAARLDMAVALTQGPDGVALDLRGVGQADGASLAGPLREAALSPFPQLDPAPFGALLRTARATWGAALDNAQLEAPLHLRWRAAERRLTVGDVRLAAANGVVLSAVGAGPMVDVNLADGAYAVAGSAILAGPGLPALRVEGLTAAGQGGAFTAGGALTIADWRGAGARLAAPALTFTLAQGPAGGRLRLIGPIEADGPTALGVLEGLALPVDLDVAWGEGLRVTSPEGACLPARYRRLRAPTAVLGPGAARVCPGPGGLFYSQSPAGAVGGGFRVAGVSAAGRLVSPAEEPLALSAAAVEGRFEGAGSAAALTMTVADPIAAVTFAPDRVVRVVGETLTARSLLAAAPWRVEGGVVVSAIEDPALTATITALGGRWELTPDPADPALAVLRLRDAVARVEDKPPPGASDWRPGYNPLRVVDLGAEVRGDAVTASGRLALEALGADLGAFTATHSLAQGAGAAELTVAGLTFGPTLQAYHLSELARGQVDNMRGAVDAEVRAAWTPTTLTANGRVRTAGLSMATISMPVIEGVAGEVAFDDLFALTTPPGQTVAIGLLNPGVEVRDGRVRFQMLPGGRVAIEDARWPLAGGALTLTPATLTIGAPQTAFDLRLEGLDTARLLEQLQIPDLVVTGALEGRLPLVVDEKKAVIAGGVLRAGPGGGLIRYGGDAGAALDELGAAADPRAKLSFDALRDFRYDDLELRLDGDLAGDLITEIRFSGRNQTANLDLSALVPAPRWVRRDSRAANTPFRFNVRVRAPFRSLGQSAASITDARVLLEMGAAQDQPDQNQPDPPTVDPPPSPGP